ncbi:MAG: tRNA (guanosine(37)-N1)-methyltransferase TrmD, partial [Bacteroidetes bacterium]|nr:tRNA (guanosine(37)-N1)-methyltransferase TrmD [Bacteroidota bacterium]
MRIDIISAVPESMISFLESSILANAQNKKIVEIFLHNLHDYADDKFKHIDDYPYGGGSGMLIKCKPVFDCIEFLLKERKYNEIIFMTPDAPILTQDTSKELALLENIIIIAGHYKGIDQRIRDVYITKEISIGDYVLSGGELPALVLIDSIVRLLPGVLNNSESALSDSLMDGFLESPQYTRPAKFRDLE